MLKAWMKILMWSGLSGGIGFFAGYQIGAKSANKRIDDLQINEHSAYEGGYNAALRDAGFIKHDQTWEDIRKELDHYRGSDFDEEDDAEMPEDIPVIPEPFEEEIPQMHPQDLLPERITEEDYYENKWGYEQDEMLYYEVDQVLVSKTSPTKPIKTKSEIDEVLGIAMIQSFYKADGEVLDAIFVKNDTLGVLFRIDRMDTAYDDPVDGDSSPDYEEEEDFTREDLEEDDE